MTTILQTYQQNKQVVQTIGWSFRVLVFVHWRSGSKCLELDVGLGGIVEVLHSIALPHPLD